MSATDSTPPAFNRWALVSLMGACLTLAAVCVGVAPIPFTGFVCFPAAIALGVVTLMSGLWSLRRIRITGERGREVALIGSAVGGFALLVVVCLLGIGLVLYPSIADLVHRWLH